RRDRLDAAIEHHLTLTAADHTLVDFLRGESLAEPLDVHVKVDTGMGRMGVLPDCAAELLEALSGLPAVRVTGIYSHFGTADFEQPEMAREQLATFRRLLGELANRLPAGCIRHIANSAATITLAQSDLDMVRPGLALFGYPPAQHMNRRI